MLKEGGVVEEEGLAAKGVGYVDAVGISCADCAGCVGSIEGCWTSGVDYSPSCANGHVSVVDGTMFVASCAVSDGGKLKPVLNK